MKNSTVKFLRFAVIIGALAIFAIEMIFFISLLANPVNPKYAVSLYPIITGIYVSSIPVYAALYNGFKFLGSIGEGIAFSSSSVKFLGRIKICFALISAIYALIMPSVVLLADMDDAPGAILFGLIPVIVSAIISIFFYILQKLFEEALASKQ